MAYLVIGCVDELKLAKKKIEDVLCDGEFTEEWNRYSHFTVKEYRSAVERTGLDSTERSWPSSLAPAHYKDKIVGRNPGLHPTVAAAAAAVGQMRYNRVRLNSQGSPGGDESRCSAEEVVRCSAKLPVDAKEGR